ncbi:MAG TPA: endopeptidase La [Candidatus Dormibacteraeota bacterium]|nr:endopeptidase La [Candidatus Dormibacteraeota bacterium]
MSEDKEQTEESGAPARRRAVHTPEIESLPLVPLRDNVVLPHQLAPLGAGRDRSVNSLEAAVAAEGKVVLAVQRQSELDEVQLLDLYPVATVAQIGAFRRGTAGAQVLVEGLRRVRLIELEAGEVWTAKFVELPDTEPEGTEIDALAGSVRQMFADYVAAGAAVPPELAVAVARAKEPGKVADLTGTAPDLDPLDRIALLQEPDVERRLRGLVPLLARQLEVAQLRNKIQQDVAQTINQGQREAILREQLKAIRKELAEVGGDATAEDDLRERIDAAGMPETVHARALKELDRLESLPSASPEVGIVRTYVEWLVDLPWKDAGQERVDIREAARILDEDHYGLPKVKERILEWMAVRKRVLERRELAAALVEATPTKVAPPAPDRAGEPAASPAPAIEEVGPQPHPLQTPILCFVGPPGVGKTSLGRSIARALGRKLVRVSLGGIRDEAEIRGHRRTYIGALPGRVIQAMKQGGTKNPVMMLDEIDKVGLDFRGDPSAALLEVLDPEQNREFSDHYLEVAYDLSQVLFITTANVIDTISAPLRDRMEIIQITGYTEEEKLGIAQQHLVPRQMEQHALDASEFQITDESLHSIIRNYTREAGVRGLDRQLAQVMRKVPRRLVENPELKEIRVLPEDLIEYLGPARFDHDSAEAEDRVGVATGVVVSDVGGDLVTVEALAIAGRTEMQLTGQIGDVMQESARAALSWVRVHGSDYGVKETFFDDHGVHIHVPAGAIPKDGPSAGVTLTTALVSVASDRPVRHDLAMTGEVTLRGRILPIGGVKDKLLAAHRAGIKVFLLPERNRRDLFEIDSSLLDGMEVVFVRSVDEVLDRALMPPVEVRPERRAVGFGLTPPPALPTGVAATN